MNTIENSLMCVQSFQASQQYYTFIAVNGDEEDEESTLEGLMAARGFIRTEIRYRMGVRHVPEITFAIDRSQKMEARMDELLGRMEKRKAKLAKKVSAKEKVAPPAAH